MTEPEEFYRYDNITYWVSDHTTETRVQETIFYLVKETPCGWWVHPDKHHKDKKENPDHLFFDHEEKPRWIGKNNRKKFAYPTREGALKGFMARKRRQIAILSSRLRQAETALKIAHSGDLSKGMSADPIRLGMDW